MPEASFNRSSGEQPSNRGEQSPDRQQSRRRGTAAMEAAGNQSNQSNREFVESLLRLQTVIEQGPPSASADATPNATRNIPRPTNETTRPSHEVPENARKNPAFKKCLYTVCAATLAGAITGGAIVGAITGGGEKNKQLGTTPSTEYAQDVDGFAADSSEIQEADNPYAGELSNGVKFDYGEYADFENKTSKNAYGHDKSECFGNREATEDALMEMASKGPEYLASYAYNILTDEEKESLGIVGMSSKEIDDYMSDANNIDGGEKQNKIYAATEQIIRDKDNTSFEFYYENGEEATYYVTFEDINGDGNYSPDELGLGYTIKKRNNAPQVAIYRMINGVKTKVIDLNMNCGLQPNDEYPPEGLPEILEFADQVIEDPTVDISDWVSDKPTPPPTINDDPEPGPVPIPEDPTPQTPPSNPTPPPQTPPSNPTPPPETPSTDKPKDPENLTRIDNSIQQVTVEQTAVTPETVTPQPVSSNETAPTIVANDSAPQAAPVQPATPANDISENHAPANPNPNPAPVQENKAAQAAADAAETPVNQAPTSDQEVDDILGDLGIN